MLSKKKATEIRVAYRRTISADYQSETREIQFVVPEKMLLSDATDLARAVVRIQLGLEITNYKKMDRLCQEVFGCRLENFENCDQFLDI